MPGEAGDRAAAQGGSGRAGADASVTCVSSAASQAAAAARPEQGGAGQAGGRAAGLGTGRRGGADATGVCAYRAPGQAAAPAQGEHGGAGEPGGGAVGARECRRAGSAAAGPAALRLTRAEWEGLVLRHLAVHTDRLGAREDFALACRCAARPHALHLRTACSGPCAAPLRQATLIASRHASQSSLVHGRVCRQV